MNAHAEEGVVDEHCKVHGVDGLYVASSATFPTSSYANPTLTIVALAIRLADHLKQVEKKHAEMIVMFMTMFAFVMRLLQTHPYLPRLLMRRM